MASADPPKVLMLTAVGKSAYPPLTTGKVDETKERALVRAVRILHFNSNCQHCILILYSQNRRLEQFDFTVLGSSSSFRQTSGSIDIRPPSPPPLFLEQLMVCRGLTGARHEIYARQANGSSRRGGIGATVWRVVAQRVFPYKSWPRQSRAKTAGSSSSTKGLGFSHTDIQRASSTSLKSTGKELRRSINLEIQRRKFTEWETRTLEHTLDLLALWILKPHQGAVYSRKCNAQTLNVSHVCDACEALNHLPSYIHALRDAAFIDRLPDKECEKRIRRTLKYTPKLHNAGRAQEVKDSLNDPAVLAVMTAQRSEGSAAAFLTLYQQAVDGVLDTGSTFMRIVEQFADHTTRAQDPTGRAMKGKRYHPDLYNFFVMMRSHGARSGAQYSILSEALGGMSLRNLRYAQNVHADDSSVTVS
jgi:hypothetical protein